MTEEATVLAAASGQMDQAPPPEPVLGTPEEPEVKKKKPAKRRKINPYTEELIDEIQAQLRQPGSGGRLKGYEDWKSRYAEITGCTALSASSSRASGGAILGIREKMVSLVDLPEPLPEDLVEGEPLKATREERPAEWLPGSDLE